MSPLIFWSSDAVSKPGETEEYSAVVAGYLPAPFWGKQECPTPSQLGFTGGTCRYTGYMGGARHSNGLLI